MKVKERLMLLFPRKGEEDGIFKIVSSIRLKISAVGIGKSIRLGIEAMEQVPYKRRSSCFLIILGVWRIFFPKYFALTMTMIVYWCWLCNDDDRVLVRNMPIHSMSLEVLRHVLRGPGPVIILYDDVLEAGGTADPFRSNVNAGTANFGLGAANHLSSPSHPILSLLKHLSTGDSVPHEFSP